MSDNAGSVLLENENKLMMNQLFHMDKGNALFARLN